MKTGKAASSNGILRNGKRGEGVNRLSGVAVNSSAGPDEQFMNPLCDINVVSDNVVSDAIDTGVPS